jgi:hypothetical protein
VTDAVAAVGAATGAAAAGAPVNADAMLWISAGALAGVNPLRKPRFGMPGMAGAGAGAGSAEAVALSSTAPGTAQATAIALVANSFLARGMGFPFPLEAVRPDATELLELLK